jgi:hypothetical protein
MGAICRSFKPTPLADHMSSLGASFFKVSN